MIDKINNLNYILLQSQRLRDKINAITPIIEQARQSTFCGPKTK